jgi:hypothetical protein
MRPEIVLLQLLTHGLIMHCSGSDAQHTMLTLLTCMTIATIPTQRIHRPIAALVLRQQAPSAWALPCSPHV